MLRSASKMFITLRWPHLSYISIITKNHSKSKSISWHAYISYDFNNLNIESRKSKSQVCFKPDCWLMDENLRPAERRHLH